MTIDTDKDGEYTEYDEDLLSKLNVRTGKYEEIVDENLIEQIRQIAFK